MELQTKLFLYLILLMGSLSYIGLDFILIIYALGDPTVKKNKRIIVALVGIVALWAFAYTAFAVIKAGGPFNLSLIHI